MKTRKLFEILTICITLVITGCQSKASKIKEETQSSITDGTEEESEEESEEELTDDTTNQTDSGAENSAPVANDASYSVVKNSSGNELKLLWSDSDAGDVVESCAVSTQPANGSLGSCSCSQGVCNISYTPTSSFSGSDSFTFTVNDGLTNSLAGTVSLNVYEPRSIKLSNGGFVTTHPFAIT